MDNKDKLAAVDRYIEAFAREDVGIIREIYAGNARVEDPVGTDVHEGIEAVCQFYEGAIGAGAKLELTGPARCAGNAVAFPFQVRTPDMRLEVIDVFEFDADGKICSMKAYWGPDNVIQN